MRYIQTRGVSAKAAQVGCAVALLASSGAAVAQSAITDNGTSQNGAQLQEVVVTANRRASTIQSTPMSITATTGAQLLNQGVASIQDLAMRTPGVSFDSRGPGRTVFTMRGMTPTGGAAATVGYYIDETPVTPPASAFASKDEVDPNLYDLARVEVLRGPQGTLYGAGSMGGTIRLITNQPKLGEFQYSGQVIGSGTHHGGFNHTINGMVNLPMGEKFALRLVAGDNFQDGYINRIAIDDFPPPTGANLQVRGDVQAASVSAEHKDVNDAHTQVLRATLLGQITDNFTVKPAIFYQRLSEAGSDTVDLPQDTFTQYQPYDIVEGYKDQFTIYSLVLKYDLPAFSVQSSSSETDRSIFQGNNESENIYTLFLPGFFSPVATSRTTGSKEDTEEVRFTSNGSGRLQWVGGLFYDNFTNNVGFIENDPPLANVYGMAQIFDFAEKDILKQYAAYGQATYQVTKPLSVTVGMRYFHYDFAFQQHGIGLVIPPISQNVYGESSRSGTTPKLTVTYQASDREMIYATAAKGFRPGAPNGPIPGNVPGADCGTALAALGLASAPSSYGPDSVWSYELGNKFLSPSRRFEVDGDIYHLNWDQIQQSAVLPCGFSFTANSGDAKADGAELQLNARLGWGFTFSESIGFVDARLTSETLPVSNTSQLQGVPRWAFNTSLEYAHPIGSDLVLIGSVNDHFTGQEYDPSPEPYPITERPGYNVVNFRLGVTRGRLSTSLFVDNLTDRFAILGFAPGLSATIPSWTRAIPLRPRTAGIDVQWSY